MEPTDPSGHLSLGPKWGDRVRFCPLCGAGLQAEIRFGQKRPTCPDCGFVLFHTPAAGAAAVVVNGRQLLLVQRRIEPYRGCWGFPAGFQEYGESPADAAVRETREETGLQIELLRLLDVLYTRDDPRKRANLVAYLARPVAGELRADDDAQDARFFSLDELPEKIAFDNNRILLQRLLRENPQGDIR